MLKPVKGTPASPAWKCTRRRSGIGTSTAATSTISGPNCGPLYSDPYGQLNAGTGGTSAGTCMGYGLPKTAPLTRPTRVQPRLVGRHGWIHLSHLEQAPSVPSRRWVSISTSTALCGRMPPPRSAQASSRDRTASRTSHCATFCRKLTLQEALLGCRQPRQPFLLVAAKPARTTRCFPL